MTFLFRSKITALPFILIFIISCKQVIKPKANIINLSYAFNLKQDSIRKGLLDEPPYPPIPFYVHHHLIVDSSGQIFYYQLPSKLIECGTVDEKFYEVPEYIGLKPNNLVRVPENSIPDFIRLNVLNQEQVPSLLQVGLQTDTIVSEGLTRLQDMIKTQKSTTFMYFRKATQEETVVLNYKKSNKYYIPEDVNWDTTKIWFYLNKLDSSYIKLMINQGL